MVRIVRLTGTVTFARPRILSDRMSDQRIRREPKGQAPYSVDWEISDQLYLWSDIMVDQ